MKRCMLWWERRRIQIIKYDNRRKEIHLLFFFPYYRNDGISYSQARPCKNPKILFYSFMPTMAIWEFYVPRGR